jgi:glycine cleavage system regulatory protein
MATLVLTVLGDDRPGLVSALSAPVSAHGASWERSEMSRLAGKFAGIVVVTVPDPRLDALLAELSALDGQGLQVTVERTDDPTNDPANDPAAVDAQRLQLELLGADRPGIVAEISAALAEARVSIEELSTDVRDAPMAGGTLFEARAVLSAPRTAETEKLRAVLEALADELMVEITLSDD